MNRRTAAATVLSVVLLICLLAAGIFVTVPYVKMEPGPTVNVFGSINGHPIVQVKGHKTYRTKGQLRLTTVSVTNPDRRINLFTALRAWADPDWAVYPYDAIYPDATTTDDEAAQSAAEMVSSQDNAIAAALTELGYDLHAVPEVLRTSPGAPADGKLKSRDQFVAINGTKIDSADQVYKAIGGLKVGDKVTIDVLRNQQPRSFTLTTVPAADNPQRAVVGVFLGQGYDFPFDVSVNLDDSIGGPSAGLIFSLGVYDTLTPGPLTGGVQIAGTGTIDEDGKVGPIGGIQQKIAAAQETGAKLFLVPPDNCDEALTAHITTDIQLVRADTMHSALESIKAYVANHAATLPSCLEGVNR